MANVEKILAERVEFQVEAIDRMYLNLYVPRIQHANGVLGFLRGHRRQQIASPALLGRMTRDFVGDVNAFSDEKGVPVIVFPRGERKEDIARKQFAAFDGKEGVVFIGVAQERASAFRSTKEKRSDGLVRFNFYRGSVSVNHYYFYILDRDFGPAFIKLCSYFPFTGRVWLNGHEWAKRQLDHAGIGYEALDNGFRSVEDAERLQALCDDLSADHVEAFVRKWLARLPSPFLPEDERAGYRHDISILQFEMSLTQVFRRPLDGRHFFEEVIRDHLDLGRPEQVRLVFARGITRRTPGPFQTRVVTRDVAPSLSFPYKHSRIKQYFKEGRALRTETTINDPRLGPTDLHPRRASLRARGTACTRPPLRGRAHLCAPHRPVRLRAHGRRLHQRQPPHPRRRASRPRTPSGLHACAHDLRSPSPQAQGAHRASPAIP